MNSMGRVLSTLAVFSLCTTAFAGCTADNEQAAPQVQTKQRARAMSAGMLVRQDVADKLNGMAGIHNATVLVHNGNAYVGLTKIGTERTPDSNQRMGTNNWNGMPYGTADTPKSAAGMTVDQMLAEGLPNAAIHSSPYSTTTGNINEETKQKIVQTVKSNVKGVKNVYISGFVEHAKKLSGYKHFILQGGNMQPHLQEFEHFVNRAFSKQVHPTPTTPETKSWERSNGWNQPGPAGMQSQQNQQSGIRSGQQMYPQPPESAKTRDLNHPQKSGPSQLD